ncbi:hypothetical protein HCN44_000835 [Aphidius gifuensis]|uniref:Uncharacterized protein n=1 Tax=Aphidius gifuensis TaxID=684658 RepID=A0A834XSF5_APHGI|nr:hypothetical protein HCN44_000835 [Aphidius gifuensis]
MRAGGQYGARVNRGDFSRNGDGNRGPRQQNNMAGNAQEMYHKGLPEVAECYLNLATLQMRNNDTDIINDKGTDDLLDLHYLSVVNAGC